MRGRTITYSAEQLLFVQRQSTTPRATLHALFVDRFQRDDVTAEHLRSLCVRKGWTTRARWSDADEAVLRQQFADTPTARIASALGRTASAVSGRAALLGLAKSATYLTTAASGRMQRGDTTGAATRFQPGQAPMNKGLKRPDGWAPGRMAETQWKKGQGGWNWKPIGAERVIGGYRYTKVRDARNVSWTTNWTCTHTLHWTAVNGPVPEGHALKSLDGDPLNVDAANWVAVPRAILPRLNGGRHRQLSYDAAPVELKPIVLLVAQVQHAARVRRKSRVAA